MGVSKKIGVSKNSTEIIRFQYSVKDKAPNRNHKALCKNQPECKPYFSLTPHSEIQSSE